MNRNQLSNRLPEPIKTPEVEREHNKTGRAKRGDPAIFESYELGMRAARVGFDWPDASGVLDKIAEEVTELRIELRRIPQLDRNKLEEEAGDLLFTAVNLTRHLNSDPETCLRRANRKFRQRFQNMQQNAHRQGRELGQCTMDELEALWNAAKEAEARGA
ncbi:MAG TPA: MazG nucleotide pyrophosphohydrolase domain-containing protein [Terriglobia bacterium]|nr:MazG nucleotide pyrophosphohydrolase domain-containing protein [Terriglobia bacterium]